MGRFSHQGRIFSYLNPFTTYMQVNVPRSSILVGCRGSASAEDINTLAEGVVGQDLLGIMVWYCSVQNGFQYEADWDCSDR